MEEVKIREVLRQRPVVTMKPRSGHTPRKMLKEIEMMLDRQCMILVPKTAVRISAIPHLHVYDIVACKALICFDEKRPNDA